MAKNDNLKDFLTDLADAIREKKGTSDPINPQDFTSEIASIETGGGGIAVETDPIFSASPAASITEAKKTEWDAKQDKIADLDAIREGAGLGATALQFVPSEYITETELNNKGYATASALNDKVDKVSGKQLSTEDFTSTLKAKLEGLNNYDDTTLSNALSTLRGDFDKLVSGDTTTAIKTFNEVIAFLDGIQDSQDLSSIIASIQQQIASKQDTISDLATIRINASKGATALQSYTETDPVFSASAAAGIKSSDITNWNSKTSNTGTITGIKMNGSSKGTSGVVDLGTVITDVSHLAVKTETNEAIAKAKEDANAYADDIKDEILAIIEEDEKVTADGLTDLDERVTELEGAIIVADEQLSTTSVNAIQNKTVTETFNKVNTDISNINTSLNGKQDTISDLSTIRSGAAKGATALQSYTEKYTGTITGITMNGASKGTSGVVNLGTVITAHQDISGKADKSSLAKVATSGSYDDLSNKPTIPSEQVNADWNATSGKAQILNKPTIPSAVTESTVSGWGFTKNTGTYSKPSGGIPKSDLASAVQTSLGKADTALQSYTEQYKGTVTGVKVNGTTKNPSSGVVDLGTVVTDISGKQDKLVSGTNIKTINGTSILGSGDIAISGGSGTITGVSANGTSIATSGVANIPAASTSAYGVTKLSTATNSTSTTLAATASAVKAAYDLANSYKGTVTSVKVNGSSKSPSSGVVDIGNVVTSIKINGSTKTPSNGVVDLGTISGGASSGSGGEEYVQLSSTENSHKLYGNKVYFLVANGSVNHSFNLFNLGLGERCRLAIYVVNIGSVSFPTLTQWSNGVPPTFTEGKLIEISFTCFEYNGSHNYLGACAEFEFRVLGGGGGN